MKFNAEKFKKLLLLNGYTLFEFSQKSGIKFRTVYSWTQKNCRMPRVDKLKIIAEFLNIEIKDLLE